MRTARPDDLRRELRRLERASPHMGDSTRDFVRHEHVRYELRRAEVAKAIATGNRWCAERDAELKTVELRAASTVGRLRAAHPRTWRRGRRDGGRAAPCGPSR